MPGKGKCEKLPLDKKQIAKVPHKPAADIIAPTSCQFNPNLQLKVADWKSWAYKGYKGYKGKRSQLRRLTASLFINAKL
eukprot:629483-Pelagomonas_calceolata.AAC.2